MTTGHIASGGFAPSIKIEPANPEAARYVKMWTHDEYRKVSPGEQLALTFMTEARPEKGASVIDFGCGTGRGGHALAKFGLSVTLVDFARNCLDPQVAAAVERKELKWVKADLTKRLPLEAQYGFCCDVLEHIPEADVQRVLANVLGSARRVFFNISTVPDHFGPVLDGAPLHLTVRPKEWWLDQLHKLGCIVHWTDSQAEYLSVYCSAWKDAAEIIQGYKINADLDEVERQTIANIEAGWQHIGPWGRQEREVCILAGGPSLADSLDEIKELREQDGAAIVTVNGSYHWALDQGLEPGMQIVLDARKFNARFTNPVTWYTKYLIASQAHPKTLRDLPPERTFLWHSGVSAAAEQLIREKTGYFFPIPGGSTVVLRALALLRMMGFYRLHLFGFDSCVNGSHHAYPQAENDNEPTIGVACGGRMFTCTPWMLSQAHEFRGMVGFLGNEVEMAVHGDGLIAHMIRTGAELSRKEN